MIYSFLYVIIASFGTVFIEKLYSSIPPFFSLIITASIATIFFNIINIGKLKATYQACWREKKLWLAIMVTILVMWNCAMISPGLIGASLYAFIYFSWLGMLGFISLSILNWKKDYSKLYFGLCILMLIFLSIWILLEHTFSKTSVLGILLAILGGTSAFIYFKQSQALVKRIQFSATQILAVRFYLTILILFIFLPRGSSSLYFTVGNMLELVLLGAVTLIIPLYFQQKALERITSELNAIIMSFSPVITAFLQEIIFKNVDSRFIIIYFLYSSIVVASYFFNKRKFKEIKS